MLTVSGKVRPRSNVLGFNANRQLASVRAVPSIRRSSRTTAARAAPGKRLVVRASGEVPKEMSKITGGVTAASQSLQQVAAKLDLTQLVQYNFFAQIVLAGVSWGILFFTTHGALAHGAKVSLGSIILIFGVLLTAYSAYLSFGYFQKVKVSGDSVLSGWAQLTNFYNHITLNFVGALAAIISLQATVGGQVVQSITSGAAAFISHKTVGAASVGLQFLAQAAANTLLAHLVSILFLTLLVKKTTDSYQAVIEMAENFRSFK